jgi:hypothetical protein
VLTNIVADVILAQTVTTATFAGPPLILVGNDLTSTDDDRWAPWAQFATDVTAPLIGLNVGENTDIITAGLRAYSRFWDYSRVRPARWSDGIRTVDLLPCGPVVALQNLGDTQYAAVAAWQAAARWHRLGGRHRFGKAMLAISSEPYPGLFSPPVYYPRSNTGASGVAELISVWLSEGGSSTPSLVSTLQQEDLTHPGMSAHVAPYLVPYLVLHNPA